MTREVDPEARDGKQGTEPVMSGSPTMVQLFLRFDAADKAPRPQLPTPMTWITDTIAQVTLRMARDPYQAELVFREGKPSPDVRATMKAAGFRWNHPDEAWTRPIGYQTAAQDRETARRVAMAVITQIRQEKGILVAFLETTPDF